MENVIKVTLLCTSDVHGFYMPWDYATDEESKFGGLTRVSTIVNKIREENPHTVLIDNGDLIQGNSAEFFLKEKKYPGIEVINKMNYEIYNMGNHEFNFGMDTLINIVGNFNEIAMMGNLYRKKNTMRFMNGIYYHIVDGIKIGFISLNTPLVRKFEAKRGNLKNYDVIDADFELKRLLEEVGEVDALIGLFHMGDFNENDIENTGVEDLLRNVPGAEKIDAVFGGHMHEIKNIKINNTIFIEPGVHAKGLSKLDLFFDKNSHKLIEIEPEVITVDDSIEQDQDLVKILEPYHNTLRDYINLEQGRTTEILNNDDEITGIPQTRVSQSLIGDFIEDVMLYYSKADVVAFHFDNFYPGFDDTIVRRKDIYDAYRYAGGEITKYNISGKDLKQYMEWSASYFNKFNKGDINISFNKDRTNSKYSTFDIFGNIKYEMDITKEDGDRVKNIRRLDDTPILDTDLIEIGLNKYRMDFLSSDKGPLKDKKFDWTWTSLKNPEIGGKGNIRELAEKYLEVLPDNTYTPKKIQKWSLSIDHSHEELRQKAITLINDGDLLLYKNKDASIDLNRSLNLFNKLEDYQVDRLKEKYDFDDNDKLIDILKKI